MHPPEVTPAPADDGRRRRAEATLWDAELARAMAATDVAVHEEAIAVVLLGDLR